MAQIQVEIRGLEKLTRLASKFPAVSQKHIDQAILRSIGEIDIQNKPITPVKTGRLRNSFIPIFRPFEGRYGSPVAYAQEVHDKYPVGQPYRRPSLNRSALAGFLALGVQRAQNVIDTAFNTALKNIVNELAD